MLHVLVLKDHYHVLTYMAGMKVNKNIEIYKFVISKFLKPSLQFQPNKKHTILLDLK